VIDENGTSIAGRHTGSEDVREYARVLDKRFRDFQYMHLELEDTYDDGDLNEEELDLLNGLD